MQHIIKPQHVMGVIIEVDAMLKQKALPFTTLEVMLGLQELVGRLIVDMAGGPATADQLVEHSKTHLDNTVRVGMQTKGMVVVPS